MQLNWIHGCDYTMDCFLMFDRWIIRCIMDNSMEYTMGSRNYAYDMAVALANYPYVLRYCERVCPECYAFYDSLHSINTASCTEKERRMAETNILQTLEVFVVYAYPEIMNNLNYIRNWSEDRLYMLVELQNKVVLDVGAGTGRLSFAAAKKAKRVYASEPCTRLRDYIRERAKRENIHNLKVTDGEILDLPFEDNTFDVVMSGYVIGNNFTKEIQELSRVVKTGGWIVSCAGEDEYRRRGPSKGFLSNGFEFFCHSTNEGGIVYDYRKQIL